MRLSKEDFFKTEHLQKDLKGRSVRGGAATISSQIFKFILQTGTTFLLARFLTPEDFGLVGMVTVILMFAEYFKDLGLSAATVQKAEIKHSQVNTLFWINVGVSLFILVVIATSGPIIAAFYDEPRLVWVTLALSTTFLISGLGIQHRALLRRQMQFSCLARVEIAAVVAATSAAVISAYFGAGYWAIVISRIAQTTTTLSAIWYFCSWRPGLPAWDPSTKRMLAFGGNITGFGLANYFSRNLDNILIGRYWGAEALGLYAIAYRLLLLPIQQINNPIAAVALPALSRLQNEPARYCRYYYKAILLITSVGIPIVVFMFVTADDLILLLLGEKWLDAVPIFRLLGPAAFFGTFNVATGWVFISLDKTQEQLKLGIVTAVLNAAIFIGTIQWGPLGIAAGFGLSRPILRIPSLMYCYKGTPLSILELAKTVAQPTIPALVAGIAVFLVNQTAISDLSALIVLMLDACVYIAALLATWMIMPGGKATLFEILSLVRKVAKI